MSSPGDIADADHDLLAWSESEDSPLDEGYDETRVEDEDWEIAERGGPQNERHKKRQMI